MPTLAHTKNFGYTEFNQNQTPESTRFTAPLNQSDAFHIGNDTAAMHDTFIWNTAEQSSLLIPTAIIGETSTTAALPTDLSNVLQSDTPSLLTQYFESTLAVTSDIVVAPMPIVAVDPHAPSQGDIDSLISGDSILSE